MLPTAAEVEDPTTVFCGKELRMGPGRVTTTAEGWMTTLELWHCLTQGSLQLLASGVGPHGWHGRHELLRALGLLVQQVPKNISQRKRAENGAAE